ncbi:MAG: hypothetical protein JWR34_7434 [Mycobacterium sp.]|nr:hypothetical protein [Mycobacterium sp.]
MYDEATSAITAADETLASLDERIEDQRAEITRTGHGNPLVQQVRNGDGSAGAHAAAWATEALTQMLAAFGGEQRAVISGSVDVPSLIPIGVVGIPHPTRIIDLLTNRVGIQSMAFEYYKQTARTNLAAPTADMALKPTSVLTVAAVNDRARVIAHLSEPVPFRIWLDSVAITSWLSSEMVAGVLDSLEAEAILGDGSGEHQVGVLGLEGLSTPSDRTHVAYTTDLPTTLRSAVTGLQNLGEVPNGWVMNPADAQAVDLLRWGSGGGLLTEGFATGVSPGNDPSSNNIFGPDTRCVVSKSCPAGTAILADWDQLKLFVREGTRLDLDASGTLFQHNQIQMRAEARVGIGITRPQAFAVVDLTP